MSTTDPGRRKALRAILFCAGAGVTVIGGSTFVLGSFLDFPQGNQSNAQKAAQSNLLNSDSIVSKTATANITTQAQVAVPQTVQVNVIYMVMPHDAIATSSEVVSVHSSSTLKDLLSELMKRHPALAAMGPAMQVLLNGMAPYGNPVLQDQDEVYFLPMSAGG